MDLTILTSVILPPQDAIEGYKGLWAQDLDLFQRVMWFVIWPFMALAYVLCYNILWWALGAYLLYVQVRANWRFMFNIPAMCVLGLLGWLVFEEARHGNFFNFHNTLDEGDFRHVFAPPLAYALSFFSMNPYPDWKGQIKVFGKFRDCPEWLPEHVENWSSSEYMAKKLALDNPYLQSLYYELLIYSALVERFTRGMKVTDNEGKVILPPLNSEGFPIIETIETDGGKADLIAIDFLTPEWNRSSVRDMRDIDERIRNLPKDWKRPRPYTEQIGELAAMQLAAENDLRRQLIASRLFPLRTPMAEYLDLPNGSLTPCRPIIQEVPHSTPTKRSPYAPPSEDKGSAQFDHYG